MKGTPMLFFLTAVAVISYVIAVLALIVAMSAASDILFVLSGVYATCGTVAMIGGGVIERLNKLVESQQPGRGE
jgi:hypothetical protein